MSDFWKLESRIADHRFTESDFINNDFTIKNKFRIGNYYFYYQLISNKFDGVDYYPKQLSIVAFKGNQDCFIDGHLNYQYFMNFHQRIYIAKNDPCSYTFEMYHNPRFDYYKFRVVKSNGCESISTFRIIEKINLTKIENLEKVELVDRVLSSKLPLELVFIIMNKYYLYDKNDVCVEHLTTLLDTIGYQNLF